MKKPLLIGLLLVVSLFLASCSNSDVPLTEAQQAKKYNMSTAEYKEMKDAAARMNMTIEEHITSSDGDSGHDMMDTSDDSNMIEDDIEMDDKDMHMETIHSDDEDLTDHWSEMHGKHDELDNHADKKVKEFEMESFTEIIEGKYYPQFTLKEIKVKKWDKVKIMINTTKWVHDFKIDELWVYSETPEWEITTIEFTADKAGEFIYWCTKPNHRENGHWGTLIVE